MSGRPVAGEPPAPVKGAAVAQQGREPASTSVVAVPEPVSPRSGDMVPAEVALVDARLDALETLEPVSRALALAAVQGVTALYGVGLARIVSRLRARGDELLDLLLEDDFIANLLILHDLHPLGLTERVERALEEARPYLHSRGGDVELAAIEDGVVRLRFVMDRAGGATMETLRTAATDAIRRFAPEIGRVEDAPQPVLVQLERR